VAATIGLTAAKKASRAPSSSVVMEPAMISMGGTVAT
jgi:hypothetical protein